MAAMTQMVYSITMRYATKRVYEWSSQLAYSVGLMASDGCLQKDGRHLDLTSVDMDQLQNFSKALGRAFHIGQKKSGPQSFGYRIQFGDVAYYDFLLRVGLTPAKSKTLGALCIPEQFYADFLRGLFDGDGTCYAYMDPRWRSSYMFYVGFTSASMPFLEYLQATNKALADVTEGSIRHGARAHTLVYAKADSYKLADFMYHEAGLLALSRKKIKLEGFIQTDRAAIITRQARVVKLVNT